MVARYGRRLYGEYGFLDSFNPSYIFPNTAPHSIVDPELGWFDSDYLGIDQGAILTMIANHRTDFVWKYMRRHPAVVTGLKRAGRSEEHTSELQSRMRTSYAVFCW